MLVRGYTSRAGNLLAAARRTLSLTPAGFVTDVDGTISKIVEVPEKAVVSRRIRSRLRRLVDRVELVAAVSGRSIDDLRRMLPVNGLVYVGNHGLEWCEKQDAAVLPEARPYLPLVADTVEYLGRQMILPGVSVEAKGASGTVHYRQAPDPDVARDSILEAIARYPRAKGLRAVEGRRVVNILPPVRLDKGTAVERLVRRHELKGVVYLGDDVTDLDAFRSLLALRRTGECDALLLAVSGSESPATLVEAADFVLDGVDAVAALLEGVVASP